MDEQTIGQVKEKLRDVAADNGIELVRVIVFGSRARDDYREDSDVDVLIVSPDFENVATARRSREFYLGWDYDQLPTPEFICLTPEEFAEQKEKKPHIVRTAVEEGVQLA